MSSEKIKPLEHREKTHAPVELPWAESLGVGIGVLGFDILVQGRPYFLKALFFALISAAIVYGYRRFKQGQGNSHNSS